jgi:hypothetical protein
MNTRVLLLLGCLLALSVQAQDTKRELWTWKDANGVTQYSDRPVPGATKVEMHTTAPAAPSASAPTPKPSAPPPRAVPAETRYELLEFISPLADESFFGSGLEITVRLRSEPELAAGDQLRIYMDGKQVDEAKDRYEHTFRNLERGAHKVTAIIFDRMGQPKINAEPRTFYIKQATIIEPKAVGPLLKPPPPKPKPTPKN